MKKQIALILLLVSHCAFAQDQNLMYRKRTAMIPMRDGIRLFTTIIFPVKSAGKYPFLIKRTPYGADFKVPLVNTFSLANTEYHMLSPGGYIFVIQDIRGKYKSEGSMQIHQPLTHRTAKGSIDESTDTYDTIDWLLKNIPDNNGKAGIYGVSYPGWLALVGAVDPHPALKAASEQACMADLFLGDDFHHNGAFRLSYGMEYSYEIEHDHTRDSEFPFHSNDLFDWYLKLGPLKNVNARYFHGSIPTWNSFVAHPNYDAYWQKNSPLDYIPDPQIPMLHVGGYFDQEDMNGPELMYQKMEKHDSLGLNHIVLGPWNHGGWARRDASHLGAVEFGSNTAEYFGALQKKWFDHYLKGQGGAKFEEAYCFQTGSNVWKTYTSWPPREATLKKLYAAQNNTAIFSVPEKSGFAEYTSNPASPVPYRHGPIEPTYGMGSHWYDWLVEDQRFVTQRPDVLSFKTSPLAAPVTVTGKINAHLVASTSGSDADWVVKLIDVYPEDSLAEPRMAGYQLPVAMEVFRGRFRKSFSTPQPLTPGKPEEFTIDLHDINHKFLRGHRLMIQVQSTWFPVIDRNPQKYVPNIFQAEAEDYASATQQIFFGPQSGTYIELPVMAE